ncbi:RTC4-like domain-containing protein [Pyrenophora seminiperda CCB06]|uniref:Restriction of telomere capping protein 4 n=1 Tax=Pyrenophora seminiperda CCB06 TaxID=1302712 RepID=A0A3M7LXE7_9PLEO|nr:RTC4-like domain-containing protein [Pyrenophora seminiperda CCB06]
MAGLTRNAPRLLRSISGKPHARDEDHEEPAPKRRAVVTKSPEEEEEDINAEPMSSDEEVPKSPPRKESKPIPTPKATADTALRKPPKRSSKRGPIRAPARGAYQNGQARKQVDDNKENASIFSAGSTGDNLFGFSIENVPQKNSKNSRGYGSRSKNLHAPPPLRKFGKAASKSAAPPERSQDKSIFPTSDDDDNVSMWSQPMNEEEMDQLKKEAGLYEPVEDPELAPVPSKKKRTKAKASKSESMFPSDDHLDDSLQAREKKAGFFTQLSTWKTNQEPESSQPESTTPRENLDEVSNYIHELPQIEEGSHCTLCGQAVEQEDYWDFWKGRDKTVKNKSAFCHAHKKKSAQDEYTQEGYPEIDWKALPRRIRRHKSTLTKLLGKDSCSIHRDRYEPLALTGKAASVPSRRTDLSQSAQDSLDSFALDEHAAYPGYYGPHGRRVITEHVMETFKSELKKSKDRVVQASGIAAFVQAVMVPEVAILLIMEDCKVDKEAAEGIREKTYNMGLLLNEEIEDEIERVDDSEEENEYQLV